MGNNNYFFQQPIDYPLVTGSSTLVVSLEEAKAALRIDSSSEDALITHLIYTATNYFELITGRDLINKTYKCYLNNFPGYNSGYGAVTYLGYNNSCGIRILKSKLQSITNIKYYIDGVLATVDPVKYYITDENDYAAIYLVNDQVWPTDADQRMQAVVITFIAGYGATAADIPYDIKQALLQYITYLYENRGDCDCNDGNGYPQSAMTFFATRKIIWLGNIC